MKAKAFMALWLCSCKVFVAKAAKALHLPSARFDAPMEIRIVTMSEFHTNGYKAPFVWNCAAFAARINRFAVYSVDIIIAKIVQKSNRFRRRKPVCFPH